MPARTTRAEIARETLTILEQGRYLDPTGREVSIRAELDLACRRSILYSPEQFEDIHGRRDQHLRERGDRGPVSFQVADETTLHAARRLIEKDGEGA